MIELLVKARNTHGSYGKGHVIDIKTSPCPWGKKECLPLFLKIRVDTDMPNITHLKSEQLMREHKITQDGKSFVVTINNASALTTKSFENVKSVLEQTMIDAKQFTVQEDKLIFSSDMEKEFLEGLLKDLLEIQYKAKRYRIKPAVVDDLIKMADVSGTVRVSLEQLAQNIDDERIEAILN